MIKRLVKAYLKASSPGPGSPRVYLRGFFVGVLSILIGLTINNWIALILGLFFISLGPIYCKIRKLKVDLNSKRFKIVFFTHSIAALLVYIIIMIIR